MPKIKPLNLIALVLLTACRTEILPKPDLVNVKYGPYERNTLDIWFADMTKITPLAIFIHGGGFQEGSKEDLNPMVFQEIIEAYKSELRSASLI